MLTVCLSPNLLAADAVDINSKLNNEYSPEQTTRRMLWLNPAVRYYQRNYSLTEISLKGEYGDDGDNYIAELGNGDKNYSINASSYIALDKSTKLFGYARFQKGRTDNILWNSQSDYAIIAPFAIGDSIGGYLDREQYSFMGGYSKKINNWTIAATLGYRASISWRDKDPRPRNIVSDLNISIGATRAIKSEYILGAFVNIQKYNQNSDITFLADKGSVSVYQMTGLAMDYIRFAGTQKSARYSMLGIGGGLNFITSDKSTAITLTGDYSHLNKELSNINNARINELKHLNFSIEASKYFYSENLEYAILVDGFYDKRNGITNIFGDATGSTYAQIGSTSHLKITAYNARLSALIGNRNENGFRWNVIPFASYNSFSENYLTNGRFVNVDHTDFGVNADFIFPTRKILIKADISGLYSNNLKNDNSISHLDQQKSVNLALINNVAYLARNYVTYSASLSADYMINRKYALSLSAKWAQRIYKSSPTKLAELQLVLKF